MDATPSSFAKFGTSYYYRSEIVARHAHDSNVARPAELNLLFDGAGHWHGTLTPLMKRYNVLFRRRPRQKPVALTSRTLLVTAAFR